MEKIFEKEFFIVGVDLGNGTIRPYTDERGDTKKYGTPEEARREAQVLTAPTDNGEWKTYRVTIKEEPS